MVGVGIVGSGTWQDVCRGGEDLCEGGAAGSGGRGSRAPALAGEYFIDCEPTIEELVARPDVDAIVLATLQTATCEIPSLPPQPENTCWPKSRWPAPWPRATQ